jgi:hypothetical protein
VLSSHHSNVGVTALELPFDFGHDLINVVLPYVELEFPLLRPLGHVVSGFPKFVDVEVVGKSCTSSKVADSVAFVFATDYNFNTWPDVQNVDVTKAALFPILLNSRSDQTIAIDLLLYPPWSMRLTGMDTVRRDTLKHARFKVQLNFSAAFWVKTAIEHKTLLLVPLKIY